MDWLFDASNFVSRNHCGKWTEWLILVNQTANFLIFLAYMTIPLSLLSLWRVVRRNEYLKQSTWIVMMFIVFIMSCGLTHLMDVLAFSWAPYRFFTVIDCLTAAASIPTAILLPGVLKKILQSED